MASPILDLLQQLLGSPSMTGPSGMDRQPAIAPGALRLPVPETGAPEAAGGFPAPAQAQMGYGAPRGSGGGGIAQFLQGILGGGMDPEYKAAMTRARYFERAGLPPDMAQIIGGDEVLSRQYIADQWQNGGRKKPIQVGDKLVDPETYKVIGDYGDPKTPEDRRTDDEREFDRAKAEGYQGDFTAWQTKGVRDREDNGFANEQALRKEYLGLPERKRYDDTRSAYERARSSAQLASGAGDIGLIFAYMKMLDPGSVVREGEFANAENSSGVPDKIRNLYNRVIDGERLNNNQRKEFIRAAGGLYETESGNLNRLNQRYSNIAGQYGIDPARVLEQAMKYDALTLPDDAPQGTPGSPSIGTVVDGYRYRGGDPGSQSSWEPVR